MRILVTGGMGEVGRPTVAHLLESGHTVRVLDLTTEPAIAGAEHVEVDVTNFEAVSAAMDGIEAVLHLAAIRHPGLAPEHRIFHINVGGTFNVFRAAADAGIKRVVCASSINALGYNFGITFPEDQLRYFPIDEAHPTYTSDPYSFSKQMIEEIGGYFRRREGISSVFLRYPAIYDLNDPDAILVRFMRESYEATLELMALPEPQLSARVAGVIADFKRRARARQWEEGFDLSYPDAAVMFGMSNFWTSLDVRDAARVAETSLLADYEGSHALYVTYPENFVKLPSKRLAHTWFPQIPPERVDVTGTETLVSVARARALLGFEPEYPYGA